MSTGNVSNTAFPPSYTSRTPTSFDHDGLPRDGARGPPAVVSKKEYIIEAQEDGAVSPKSRVLSRRNLVIGLFVLLVILGAALGGALGATLGKHSSSNAAAKTSSSVPPSSTTSSVPSGSTTSATTTTATTTTPIAGQSASTSSTASTTTTTGPSSPPLVTPGVAYTVRVRPPFELYLLLMFSDAF